MGLVLGLDGYIAGHFTIGQKLQARRYGSTLKGNRSHF